MAKPKEAHEHEEARETTGQTKSQPQSQGAQRPDERQSSQAGQTMQSRGGRKLAPQRQEPSASTGLYGGPFGLISQFAGEIDRLLEGFGFGGGSLATRGHGGIEESSWSPQIEVFEREG